MLDEIDIKILNILQANSRESNAAIARETGMVTSAIFERIKKLKAQGVIKEFQTNLDLKALGYGVLAYIFVRVEINSNCSDPGIIIAEIPEVQEVHHIAGEDCLLVKIWAQDTDALGDILTLKFHTIQGVRATKTTIVLKSVKDTSIVPLQLQEG